MIPEALAGGRAPRAWQRGMARAAAPLGALRRSTAWLAGLARVRLGLREEPLLGSCFTELALRPFPSGEPKEAAARPAPSRSRLQEPSSRLTRSSAGEPGSPRERRQAPPVPRTEERRPREQEEGTGVRDARAAWEPLLLEGRAGRELLERLAENNRLPANGRGFLPPARGRLGTGGGQEGGAPKAKTVETPSAPLLTSPQSQPSPSPGGGARRPRFLPEASPPSRRGTAEGRHRTWLEALSRRVGRILGELSGSSRPSTRLETEPAPRSAGPAPVELPAPWRLNLQGEPAPPSLLERWRTPGLGAPPRTQRPGASPGSPSRRSSQPLSKEEPRFAVPALEQSGEAPERRRSRNEEVEHQASTLLPPPPSLPPFLRANGAGDGLARRPAPEVKTVLAPPDGPAVGEEDLDALAAKLQRILDEEARRHGIPV